MEASFAARQDLHIWLGSVLVFLTTEGLLAVDDSRETKGGISVRMTRTFPPPSKIHWIPVSAWMLLARSGPGLLAGADRWKSKQPMFTYPPLGYWNN